MCPSPLRGRIKPAHSGSEINIANPVGTSSHESDSRIRGLFMQALRSMAAEPGVAVVGKFKSFLSTSKIDGKNSKIYQTNHVLRSVYVPDGEHEVVFYYDNSNWQAARLTSRVSFFLAAFLCLFLFYKERRSNLK